MAEQSDLHALWLKHCTSCVEELETFFVAESQQRNAKRYASPLLDMKTGAAPLTHPEELFKVFATRDTVVLQQFLWPLLVNATWTIGHDAQRFVKHAQIEINIIEQLHCLSGLGQTLAHHVARRSPRKGGAYELVVLLEKLGLNLQTKDKYQQTPLFYAARAGNVACVAYLLSSGCKADDQDFNLQTGLHYAVLLEGQHPGQCFEDYRGPKKFRQLPDAKGSDNYQSRCTLVDMLLSCRCNPELSDRSGLQAVDYCIDQALYAHLKLRMCEIRQGTFPNVQLADHMPSMSPPYIYMSQPTDLRKEQYMILEALPADVQALFDLETEFIEDHRTLLETSYPASVPPEMATVCETLGLEKAAYRRKELIRTVDCKGTVTYCTLKADGINFEDVSLGNLVNGIRPETKGYLSMQCFNFDTANVQKAIEAFERGDAERYYAENLKNTPMVNIRYLKVQAQHRGLRVGRTLICGMLQHLRKHNLEMCMRDMRMLVYANNAPARGLYEKLGFVNRLNTKKVLVDWPYTKKELEELEKKLSLNSSVTGSDPAAAVTPGGGSSSSAALPQANSEDYRNRYIRWCSYRRVDLSPTRSGAERLIPAFEAATKTNGQEFTVAELYPKEKAVPTVEALTKPTVQELSVKEGIFLPLSSSSSQSPGTTVSASSSSAVEAGAASISEVTHEASKDARPEAPVSMPVEEKGAAGTFKKEPHKPGEAKPAKAKPAIRKNFISKPKPVIKKDLKKKQPAPKKEVQQKSSSSHVTKKDSETPAPKKKVQRKRLSSRLNKKDSYKVKRRKLQEKAPGSGLRISYSCPNQGGISNSRLGGIGIFHVKREYVLKFGFTPKCMGCQKVEKDDKVKRAHSAACRKRIMFKLHCRPQGRPKKGTTRAELGW
mmetsp:Transcript_92777/g.170465  ORF Transcript_92777/g.170465 Transcript_92777/m.170465 type:complete len:887 (+) Transcript_92777:83-2743(+)